MIKFLQDEFTARIVLLLAGPLLIQVSALEFGVASEFSYFTPVSEFDEYIINPLMVYVNPELIPQWHFKAEAGWGMVGEIDGHIHEGYLDENGVLQIKDSDETSRSWMHCVTLSYLFSYNLKKRESGWFAGAGIDINLPVATKVSLYTTTRWHIGQSSEENLSIFSNLRLEAGYDFILQNLLIGMSLGLKYYLNSPGYPFPTPGGYADGRAPVVMFRFGVGYLYRRRNAD